MDYKKDESYRDALNDILKYSKHFFTFVGSTAYFVDDTLKFSFQLDDTATRREYDSILMKAVNVVVGELDRNSCKFADVLGTLLNANEIETKFVFDAFYGRQKHWSGPDKEEQFKKIAAEIDKYIAIFSES